MEVPLPQGDVLIGRGQECYLRINEPMVSRRHARLRVSPDRVTLEDLGSRNGSYLNGIGVGEAVSLTPGDLVVVGSQQFTLELGEEPGARRNTSVAQTMGGQHSAHSPAAPQSPMSQSFSGPTVAPQAPSGASPQGAPSGSMRIPRGALSGASSLPSSSSIISVGGDARGGLSSLSSLGGSSSSLPTSIAPAFSLSASGSSLGSTAPPPPAPPSSGSRLSPSGEGTVPVPLTTAPSLALCLSCGAPVDQRGAAATPALGDVPACPRCGAAVRSEFGESAPTMTTKRGSSAQLLWGLSDKVLAIGRTDEAEKMMTPRLQHLLDQAEAGATLDEESATAALRRALRLCAATRKDKWLEWIFSFARACSYRLPPVVLDELYTLMFTMRPALAVALSIHAYAQMVSDEELSLRLVALRRLCRE